METHSVNMIEIRTETKQRINEVSLQWSRFHAFMFRVGIYVFTFDYSAQSVCVKNKTFLRMKIAALR